MNQVSLKHYAAAGYPAVCIATADEDRIVSSVLASFPKRIVLRIAATGGLISARDNVPVDEKVGYLVAFQKACTMPQTVLVVLDYQHIVKQPGPYRMLRDMLPRLKTSKSLLVLVAPSWTLPAELEHDIPVETDVLPTREELRAPLQLCADMVPAIDLTKIDVNPLLDSVSGLTIAEAENTLALSRALNKGQFNAQFASDAKMRLVRQSGLAEIVEPASPQEIGGYGEFQDCIDSEVIPSMSDSQLAVSGISADGVQGTGKSLGARILSGKLGWPIMRVDIESLKARSGGIVGQSEKGIIDVFKLARAVAPVILFFDEIEKGFRGSTSSGDSGVSPGMSGVFLTQTQEVQDNHEKVILYATSNDFQALPAEITRRFEIQFFFDLPGLSEREEIARIKLAKFAAGYEKFAQHIAEQTHDWTGSEIEKLVRTVARKTKRVITQSAIDSSLSTVSPLAKIRAEEITRLRDWGKSNLRLANTAPGKQLTKPKRTVSVIDTDMAENLSGGNA